MRLNEIKLATLTGTEAQICWADSLRKNVFDTDLLASSVLEELAKISDATWWIANRKGVSRGIFEEPQPWQLEGGGPKPIKPARKPAAGARAVDPANATPLVISDYSDGTHSGNAKQFARSVSQTPYLAEITILALLSQVYTGETRRLLLEEAKTKLDPELIADAITRDSEGVKRILDTLVGRLKKES